MDNRIKDAFDGIHAEESLKQSTKAFLVDKSRSKSKPARVSYRSPITAFACAVLIFIGMSGCILFFTPVTAIAMDVNPSVELSVNRFEIVVSVSGLNEDGKALAKNSDAKYKNYLAAVDALMESEEMQECLADDATVSVTVIGNNEKKNEEMMNKISSCKYSKNFECTCASREDAQAAREAGLPLGKYRAFQQLKALDPAVTAQDIQKMTMRQIRERIAQLSGEGKNNSETVSGAGNGNGSNTAEADCTKVDGNSGGYTNQNGSGKGNGNRNGKG